MRVDEDGLPFVQQYSLWKVTLLQLLAITVIVSVLVIDPSTLTYTRIFYDWPFLPILAISVIGMTLLVLLFMPVVRRALRRLPAIVITDREIIVFSNRKKRADIADVTRITLIPMGNAVLHFAGRRSFSIPVSLCEQPSLVLEHLKQLGVPTDFN